PRIEKFKREEKAAKEAKRKEKEEAAKNAKEAAKRAAEEERIRKEQVEAEAKQKQLEEKKKKDARKKSIRNERKIDEPPPVDVIDKQLSELDTLFENLSLEDLQNVRKQMNSVSDGQSAKNVLINEVTRLINSGTLASDSIAHFKQADNIESLTQNVIPVKKQDVSDISKEESKEKPWGVEEISLLIKAANKFPGGTANRWEKIGEYVADHTGLPPRTNEELIKKSKEVQRGAGALNEEDVRKLQHSKKHADTRISEHPSMREATINYDDPFHVQNCSHESPKPEETEEKPNSSSKPITNAKSSDDSIKTNEVTLPNGSASTAASNAASSITPTVQSTNVWTAAQQAQLERALQTYPPSWKGDGDRWDKIAAAVEVIIDVDELAEIS
ncbi:14150_t:CDS:2, partial [Acaulospora colombiana]